MIANANVHLDSPSLKPKASSDRVFPRPEARPLTPSSSPSEFIQQYTQAKIYHSCRNLAPSTAGSHLPAGTSLPNHLLPLKAATTGPAFRCRKPAKLLSAVVRHHLLQRCDQTLQVALYPARPVDTAWVLVEESGISATAPALRRMWCRMSVPEFEHLSSTEEKPDLMGLTSKPERSDS